MTEKEFKSKVVLPMKSVMYGIALRMGISPDEAADVVQDTLIRLWRANDRIPLDEAGARAYCMAAFRNCCITAIGRRRDNVPLDAVAEIASGDADSAEYSDTRRKIEILIKGLPPGQRDVIRMSGFADMDCDEIARATGLTEGNVRQLLSRGRKRLRELMTKI